MNEEIMSDDERNILENETTESIIEPPRRPYKMTMEVPVFLTALSISLSGECFLFCESFFVCNQHTILPIV